jgi:uncharacterized CHY-type Zn-finger protein
MACPDCNSSFGEYRNASSVETHGLDCGPYERFEQEYIVCRQCRGQFDIYEWGSTELSSDPRTSALFGVTPHAKLTD